MKAKRMRDVVDAACNDTASSAYDCSNGILSNSGTEYTNATEDTQYHLLNLANGTIYEVESVSTIVDKVWVYRESSTVNTAATASYESEENTW
jgi:hypothetical protein